MEAADLFLSPTLTDAAASAYLASVGFRHPESADQRLQELADDLIVREALGRIAGPLLDGLTRTPDPDAALTGFARYVSTCISKPGFLRFLRDEPVALDALTRLLGASPMLRDILVRNPEYFYWVLPQIDRPAPPASGQAEYVAALLTTLDGLPASLNALRRLKRREVLRIAARDLFDADPPQVVVAQLADLAETLVRHAFELIVDETLTSEGRSSLPGAFAVIALGRLGQREMDYGTGLDLLYVFDAGGGTPANAHEAEVFEELAWRLTSALGDDTNESELYRVTPATPIVSTGPSVAVAVSDAAGLAAALSGLSDRLLLATARPIAGDAALGSRVAAALRCPLGGAAADRRAAREILQGEVDVLQRERFAPPQALGIACLTMLERFTHALQLAHGLLGAGGEAGTAAGLNALCAAGVLDRGAHERLAAALEFLRRLTRRLQLVQEADGGVPHEREVELCARQLGFGEAAILAAELHRCRDDLVDVCRSIIETA